MQSINNDDDIILLLQPHPGPGFNGAADTVELTANQPRLWNPLQGAEHDIAQHEQITADPPETQRVGPGLPDEHRGIDIPSCLVVRFSQGCRTRRGVVCGCDENADLVLPSGLGISNFHLALTFDAENIPVVEDLQSSGGTKVTYNGEAGERLSGFTWSLIGPSIAGGNPPILNISDSVQFKVIVPARDFSSPDYVARVEQFRQGTADPTNLFATLDIPTTDNTRLPTGQQSPSNDRSLEGFFYEQDIGEGSFGWRKHIRAGTWDKESWVQEADIMKNLSHEHIVELKDATFDPYPELKLEYVPGGSLASHDKRLSEREGAELLCQLSSALKYLHNMEPPICHRDIKPENILVAERTDDNLYVKFGDFGLSKASAVLETFCGTWLWAAPEIFVYKYRNLAGIKHMRYTVAVDIWSLGVVVAAQVFGGLPDWKDEYLSDPDGTWVRKVQQFFTEKYHAKGGHLLGLLAKSMIQVDAGRRASADEVHRQATEILDILRAAEVGFAEEDDEEGASTPKLMSVEEAPTLRPGPNGGIMGQQTEQIMESLECSDDVLGQSPHPGTVIYTGGAEQAHGLALVAQPSQAGEASESVSQSAMECGLSWAPESQDLTRLIAARRHAVAELGAFDNDMMSGTSATVHRGVDGDGEQPWLGGDDTLSQESARKRKWPKASNSPSLSTADHPTFEITHDSATSTPDPKRSKTDK